MPLDFTCGYSSLLKVSLLTQSSSLGLTPQSWLSLLLSFLTAEMWDKWLFLHYHKWATGLMNIYRVPYYTLKATLAWHNSRSLSGLALELCRILWRKLVLLRRWINLCGSRGDIDTLHESAVMLMAAVTCASSTGFGTKERIFFKVKINDTSWEELRLGWTLTGNNSWVKCLTFNILVTTLQFQPPNRCKFILPLVLSSFICNDFGAQSSSGVCDWYREHK